LAGSYKVAVLGAPPDASYNTDVVNKLNAAGVFSRVDSFIVGGPGAVTPTLAQLAAYNAVLVYSDWSFADPATLGNNLAKYVDAGGGLVITVFALGTAIGPQGTLISGGYLPVALGDQNGGNGLSLAADDPGSPILSGVTSFNGGTSSYFDTVSVANGGTQVAHWNNGTPLVVTKTMGAGKVVALNMYPPSSDVSVSFWTSSTSGGQLMANALAWAAGVVSVDTTAPTVVSIVRESPSTQMVSTNTVVCQVTFSESVTNVSAGSFVVTPVGASTVAGSVTSVSGGPQVYDVTVGLTGGVGPFRLDVPAH
jgi:hypothetical protein